MASHYAALQGRFMLALDIQHVRMKQHATDKAQALQCLVDILVEDQLVTPDYIFESSDRITHRYPLSLEGYRSTRTFLLPS